MKITEIIKGEEKPVISKPAVSDDYVSDVLQFIEDTKDDPEFFKKALQSFPKNVSNRMGRLQSAMLSKETKEITIESHKFISIFSAIPIYSASKISMELQNAARGGELEKCYHLFEELQSKMEAIVNYIQSIEV